jgi:hypothetical protein
MASTSSEHVLLIDLTQVVASAPNAYDCRLNHTKVAVSPLPPGVGLAGVAPRRIPRSSPELNESPPEARHWVRFDGEGKGVVRVRGLVVGRIKQRPEVPEGEG